MRAQQNIIFRRFFQIGGGKAHMREHAPHMIKKAGLLSRRNQNKDLPLNALRGGLPMPGFGPAFGQNRLQRFGIRQRPEGEAGGFQRQSHQRRVQPAPAHGPRQTGRGFPRHAQPFAVPAAQMRFHGQEKLPVQKRWSDPEQ